MRKKKPTAYVISHHALHMYSTHCPIFQNTISTPNKSKINTKSNPLDLNKTRNSPSTQNMPRFALGPACTALSCEIYWIQSHEPRDSTTNTWKHKHKHRMAEFKPSTSVELVEDDDTMRLPPKTRHSIRSRKATFFLTWRLFSRVPRTVVFRGWVWFWCVYVCVCVFEENEVRSLSLFVVVGAKIAVVGGSLWTKFGWFFLWIANWFALNVGFFSKSNVVLLWNGRKAFTGLVRFNLPFSYADFFVMSDGYNFIFFVKIWCE